MKIAYFDYWTEGIQNFASFDSMLRERGDETLLLHVGSFNEENLKEEMVEGIKCRDISFYNTKMIYRMLEREKPDIIITLNTTKLLDRVVTMSCRKLKIKSIYLMHGMRDMGSSNDQLVAQMEQSYNSFIKKIKKAGKYFTIVIPNYLYVLLKYKIINILNFRFIRVIYLYYKSPGKAFYFPEYRDELINDKCLVYSANEGKYYEKLGYSEKNITVVGNPKNDPLNDMIINNKFRIEMLPENVQNLVQEGKKYAIYLEESFPEQNNFCGFTSNIRDKFIMDCASRLECENLKLVVKLHPTTNEESIIAMHDNCLIEKNHLDILIYFSEFSICHMSTAINNCILMNKSVIIPQWNSSDLPTFFTDAGVANSWNNIDDELNLTIDRAKREKYIKNYITVVTPDAVQNVIRAIGA